VVIDRVLLATGGDADQRKLLAAVRALGGRGTRVTLFSDSDFCLARYSRHCHDFIQVPARADNAGHFTKCLQEILVERPQDALLPLCDFTTQAFAHNRNILNEVSHTCLPATDAMYFASDKGQLLTLADDNGIAIPRTFTIQCRDDLEQAAESLGFPCVLKPRRSAGGVGRSFIDTPGALRSAYDALPQTENSVFDGTLPLLQEYIPGEVVDACLLFCYGKPRAGLTQRRILMAPSEGGLGIYNETTRDPELMEQAIALLGALDWHGPAQVEFKRDARDGRLRLMEVNSRFWGTLDLSIRAGIDFPYLAALAALEGDIEKCFDYQVGMRFRWLFSYKSPQKPVANLQWRALLDGLLGRKLHCTDFLLRDPVPHLAGFASYCNKKMA
jgi:predicted ATP-grasp superfamily ATP-dependent carboligase